MKYKDGNLSNNRSKLYICWTNMKQRCLNKNHRDFHHYGGRGITICDEWLSFEPFAEWALANGYSDELTLDRRNNNEGYCPQNCRWITMQEQCTNRRMPITNTSGYMGVTTRKTPYGIRFVAEIERKGEHIYLGTFNTPEEAASVYGKYVREVLHESCAY